MDARSTYAGILDGLVAHLRLMELSGFKEFYEGPPSDEGPLRRLFEEIKACGKCRRHGKGGTPGARGARPRVAFVVPAPPDEGSSEDGHFKGPVGELLQRIIKSMGLDRDGAYVCYALKCAVPDEDGRLEEAALNCGAFLEREIECLGPEAVVLFGRVPTLALLGRDGLSGERGRILVRNGLRVMPTHDLVELMQSKDLKKEAWQGMQSLMKELGLSAHRA
jgi:DNA polymerase